MDFAVWIPFADRNLPRHKFNGMAFGNDGTLTMMEIYGPGNFKDWVASYNVFRTAAICFEVIDAEVLDQYRD